MKQLFLMLIFSAVLFNSTVALAKSDVIENKNSSAIFVESLDLVDNSEFAFDFLPNFKVYLSGSDSVGFKSFTRVTQCLKDVSFNRKALILVDVGKYKHTATPNWLRSYFVNDKSLTYSEPRSFNNSAGRELTTNVLTRRARDGLTY